MTTSLKLALSLFFIIFVTPAVAEQAKNFGDYTVHYSALTTDVLSPGIAKSYGISRSRNRALLNISIIKKGMGTAAAPVRAKVSVTAVNLSAQLSQPEVRELIEPGAVYYLSEIPVNHGEVLTFTIEVLPLGGNTPYSLSFQQQFVTRD